MSQSNQERNNPQADKYDNSLSVSRLNQTPERTEEFDDINYCEWDGENPFRRCFDNITRRVILDNPISYNKDAYLSMTQLEYLAAYTVHQIISQYKDNLSEEQLKLAIKYKHTYYPETITDIPKAVETVRIFKLGPSKNKQPKQIEQAQKIIDAEFVETKPVSKLQIAAAKTKEGALGQFGVFLKNTKPLKEFQKEHPRFAYAVGVGALALSLTFGGTPEVNQENNNNIARASVDFSPPVEYVYEQAPLQDEEEESDFIPSTTRPVTQESIPSLKIQLADPQPVEVKTVETMAPNNETQEVEYVEEVNNKEEIDEDLLLAYFASLDPTPAPVTTTIPSQSPQAPEPKVEVVSQAPLPPVEETTGVNPVEALTAERIGWLQEAGIAESDWAYVNFIVTKESSWNYKAVNAQTSATGLPQSIPSYWRDTWAEDFKDNPVSQLKWQKWYIEDRYGSYAKAFEFWKRNNWY